MSGNVDIDLEKVRSSAGRLQELSADFGLVADYLGESEGDASLFGAAGQPFTLQYFTTADAVKSMLREMTTAGEGLKNLMDQACDKVEEADTSSSENLNALIEELLDE